MDDIFAQEIPDAPLKTFTADKLKAEVRDAIWQRLAEVGIDPRRLKNVTERRVDSGPDGKPATQLRLEFFGIGPALIVNVPGHHLAKVPGNRSILQRIVSAGHRLFTGR
jgi:hypothetical protein